MKKTISVPKINDLRKQSKAELMTQLEDARYRYRNAPKNVNRTGDSKYAFDRKMAKLLSIINKIEKVLDERK